MNKTLVVIDFETTGLLNVTSTDPNDQPRIIEIGAIRSDGARISQFIQPEISIDEKITQITGITNANLIGQPTFYEFFPEFAEFMCGAKTWVGFNNSFDMQVLGWCLTRYDLQYKFPWPYVHIDVMKASKDFVNIAGKSDVKYPKLSELYAKLFNESFSGAHRAINDCEATLRCFQELINKGIINT